MDWFVANPQIDRIFSSLGSTKGEEYVINPHALAILEDINCKLTYEDQSLRSFRRAIGFGQYVRNDLIPLLINAKDLDVVDAVIRILVNLTVPVECLFCVDVMYRTEVGRCTIFELNKLLITSKEAFSEAKSTQPVISRIKTILEYDTKKLSPAKCDTINNCLLLIRNILHIPETNLTGPHSSGNSNHVQGCTGQNGQQASLQNLLLWNLFIQSIDKLLIYLMSCPQKSEWSSTIVQLIALMYKDQHVSILQKLLNNWFEASLSDSSEDNESNTTPPNKCSGESSPMLTSSDPTSDSSDNGNNNAAHLNNKPDLTVDLINEEERRQINLDEETKATLHEVSRKGREYKNSLTRVIASTDQNSIIIKEADKPNKEISMILEEDESTELNDTQSTPEPPFDTSSDIFVLPSIYKTKIGLIKNHRIPTRSATKSPHSGIMNSKNGVSLPQKRECPSSTSEFSDCGYSTQVENQENISTSSNDDEKTVHQKPPCSQKPRYSRITAPSAIAITSQEKKEWRRKKLVKRSKSNLIHMKGLVQLTPSDEDISNILKEFTVDFLLKGYDYLVHDIHEQFLTDWKIPIDTSHFFWLVTYFLKFASQLELDLGHVSSVLNFEVLNCLVYEGVTLCEHLDMASRQQNSDLKPYLRRIHLVVTALREFLQALDTYKKISHLTNEDRQQLRLLQLQISGAENLRSLFILLIRRYNANIQSRQYLQDLIVTNHLLLVLLDKVMKEEDQHLVTINIAKHIAKFADVEVMYQYGVVLQDYSENGEYVNDCVFTMMHHVAGDLKQVSALFQPIVLKTFSRIWETEFEVCDDWSDLIEYVIHKFMKTPQKNQLLMDTPSLTELIKEHNLEHNNWKVYFTAFCMRINNIKHIEFLFDWKQEEKDALYWYYVQSKKTNECVGRIRRLYSDNGKRQKSRISIIQQLLEQDIITLVEYDDLMNFEDFEYQKELTRKSSTSTIESGIDLKESYIGNESVNQSENNSVEHDDIEILKNYLISDGKGNMLMWLQNFLLECCYVKQNIDRGVLKSTHSLNNGEIIQINIMEAVPFHCILKRKSIPIILWSTEEEQIMTHQPFVLLIHKLGFHLPIDAESVFPRIPEFWTADIMYNVAKKLGPIDKAKLKFDANLLKSNEQNNDILKWLNEKLLPTEKEELSHPIKLSNKIRRYSSDPLTVPNWLQLVMKSKCSNNYLNINSDNEIVADNTELYDNEESSTKTIEAVAAAATLLLQNTKKTVVTAYASTDLYAFHSNITTIHTHNTSITTLTNSHEYDHYSDDDSAIKSLNDSSNNTSGYLTRRSSNIIFESDFINNCETVSSDLTRMYVSDEDNIN